MSTTLPPDHADRLDRALLSLDGLSAGHPFGSPFLLPGVWRACFAGRQAPPGPWRYTDDTEMALGIVEVLRRHGTVEQYDLARVFARRYEGDVYRGYGPGAHVLLSAIANGTPWRNAS